jgi:hypothetical protein
MQDLKCRCLVTTQIKHPNPLLREIAQRTPENPRKRGKGERLPSGQKLITFAATPLVTHEKIQFKA